MITKITSKKVELPVIYLVETKEDFENLPKGLPYIVGSQSDLPFIRIFLEFQVLYKSCLKTNLPVKWLDILKRMGFNVSSIKNYKLQSGGDYWKSSTGDSTISIDDFIQDQYIVSFERLSDLKILPKWLEDLKEAIQTNIIDEVMFNPTAFNKQLGFNLGAGEVKHNSKNLLILDVSGSIPRSVVKTTVALSKLMSKRFYADILITSGQSVLIDYENVQDSDIEEIVRVSGCGNEGQMFSKIIAKHKKYNTVIAFGDNDNPQYYLKEKSCKCNFEVEMLYSLHTDKNTKEIVGYARQFKPKSTEIVTDWIQTINK